MTWLANAVGCDYRHLRGILDGTRSPSLVLLEDIAEAVGMEVQVSQTISTDVKLRLTTKSKADHHEEQLAIEEPPLVYRNSPPSGG